MSAWVVLGRVSGLYGIKGWVKVFSYTEPRQAITRYNPLYLNIDGEWKEYRVADGRSQGKSVVIKFDGLEDRDAAALLTDRDIAVSREQLPSLAPDEYYWADLQGLRVITTDGVELGQVAYLLETGANDVLVVDGERERLIPFLRNDVVVAVDLAQKQIRVDWDPDF
jgi:16S rRNA processing protein RimM